jgi:hypothetical protein
MVRAVVTHRNGRDLARRLASRCRSSWEALGETLQIRRARPGGPRLFPKRHGSRVDELCEEALDATTAPDTAWTPVEGANSFDADV